MFETEGLHTANGAQILGRKLILFFVLFCFVVFLNCSYLGEISSEFTQYIVPSHLVF
jgi:hypothetical protein